MEEIEFRSNCTENYPDNIDRGDCFYISGPDQFRGKHFVVINVHPEVVDSDNCRVQVAELDVCDTSMNQYTFRDMGNYWLVMQPNSEITVHVQKDAVVIED